ncbi:hypothetical protein [Aureimonas sp. N4]|uniref:hypothetical protein n=1 Tax=Aureimonas sp. N4 TaxID=1638165 RepID=UPI0007855A29|nr:hypothetical protein [Aureimonas sp. N4]
MDRVLELEARVAELEALLTAHGIALPGAEPAPPASPPDYAMRDRIAPVAARLLMDGPASHSAISRKVKAFATSGEVEAVMVWMVEGGDVVREVRKPETGRPSTIYRLAASSSAG